MLYSDRSKEESSQLRAGSFLQNGLQPMMPSTVSCLLAGAGEGFQQGGVGWEGPGFGVKALPPPPAPSCVCRCFCPGMAELTTVVTKPKAPTYAV